MFRLLYKQCTYYDILFLLQIFYHTLSMNKQRDDS